MFNGRSLHGDSYVYRVVFLLEPNFTGGKKSSWVGGYGVGGVLLTAGRGSFNLPHSTHWFSSAFHCISTGFTLALQCMPTGLLGLYTHCFPPALCCIPTGFPLFSTAYPLVSPWLSNACPLVSACDNLQYKIAKVCMELKESPYMIDLESLTSRLLHGRLYRSSYLDITAASTSFHFDGDY